MTAPQTSETRLKLGPDDAGRALTREEYEQADLQAGYRYELVAGRLCVTPFPNPPHLVVQMFLVSELTAYSKTHSETVNMVGPSRLWSRTFGADTDLEPDVALYRAFPKPVPPTWEGIYPFLVVEVISPSNPQKDLLRNRFLYWEVPAIEEYWIVDPRQDPSRPTLLALARGEEDWIERRVEAGGQYRTDLLPGFVLDLSRVSS